MNGTTLERPDVAAFLEAVRSELSDLPPDERDDLLAEVEASLVDSGDAPLLAPEEFAAELREAAGLGPNAVTSASPPRLAGTIRAWAASERAMAIRATARELAPIWWLLRAYAAVAAAALLLGLGWPIGSGTSGNGVRLGESLLAVVLATLASVWLGLRARRSGGRRVGRAANVALALALVPVAAHSFEQVSLERGAVVTTSPEPVAGLALDGVPLRNLYPYSRDGELLLDVLLYDEHGRPVDVRSGAEDTQRRILATEDGTPLLNSFPIRYYEPGTTRVARPELGPRITLPEVATPRLERSSR